MKAVNEEACCVGVVGVVEEEGSDPGDRRIAVARTGVATVRTRRRQVSAHCSCGLWVLASEAAGDESGRHDREG